MNPEIVMIVCIGIATFSFGFVVGLSLDFGD